MPIIAGPTASGKTALGVAVCEALAARGLAAEVVTADAFQIYRGMDIGTAKPTAEERKGVPHHLIDLVEPEAAFTVADWLRDAESTIATLRARGVVPVVVGGTHLYVKSLIDGMFEGPGADESLRAELRARPLAELRAELERVDPVAAARIHANDSRRTIRALEVFRLTGVAISAQQGQWDSARAAGDRVLVALEWPAEVLSSRINTRVRAMVAAGLVEEVEGLWRAGRFGAQSREAVGYRQLIEYFEMRERAGGVEAGGAEAGGMDGKRRRAETLDEAIERVKIQTRQVAKSQRTWIRRLRTTPSARFIDAATLAPEEWTGVVLEAMGV
jgi:tRNA dimethylallyltransferase